MASVNVTVTGTTLTADVGDNTVAAGVSAAAAAASASAAAAAATSAASDVAAAIAADVAASEAARDGAEAAATDARTVAETGWGLAGALLDTLAPLVERHGSSVTNTSANVNAVARAFDCPDQFAPNYIDGVRAIADNAAAALITAKVWERDSASASLNGIPGSAGDVLVTSATISRSQFIANGYVVPVPRYLAKSGKVYLVAVEAYGSDGTTRVALSYNFLTVPDEAQRFEGFTRTGAGDYANFTSTRSLSMGILTSTLVSVPTERAHRRAALAADLERNYRQMVSANEAALRADCFMDPIGSGLSIRFGGDSLCQQSIGSPTRTSSAVVALLLSGSTVVNAGAGGQTSTQINATLSARSAAEWGWTNFVNATTNDEASFTYAASKAQCDDIISKFTGQWVFSPAIVNGGDMSFKQRRLLKELRASHGARIFDWSNIVQQFEDLDTDADGETGDAADDSATRVDGLHLSSLGCSKLGLMQAAMIRAMNGRAPYVHEEVLPLRAGDAAGTDYSGGLILGTVRNVVIEAGDNSDGAVDINATTGAIGRGAGTLVRGSRELIVRAENEYGTHRARKTFLICRDSADSSASKEVRFLGKPSQVVIVPPADAGGDTIAAPTKLSMFVSMRLLENWGGSFDNISLLQVVGNSVRFTGRYNASGSFIGSSPTFPVASNPFAATGYFLSIDTDTGLLTYATNEVSASVVIPADSAAIRANITTLFTSPGALLRGVALRRYMLFTGRAFDFTNAANRELFYDPVTRLPKDVGGASTVDGTQAVIDLHGREGDWFLGRNTGSLGDLLAPTWRGMRHAGIKDVDA